MVLKASAFIKSLWNLNKKRLNSLQYFNFEVTFATALKSEVLSMESCLRGRKDMFAKHAYGKLYQGFESLTLRGYFRGVA